jgi:hypothetical protein
LSNLTKNKKKEHGCQSEILEINNRLLVIIRDVAVIALLNNI